VLTWTPSFDRMVILMACPMNDTAKDTDMSRTKITGTFRERRRESRANWPKRPNRPVATGRHTTKWSGSGWRKS